MAVGIIAKTTCSVNLTRFFWERYFHIVIKPRVISCISYPCTVSFVVWIIKSQITSVINNMKIIVINIYKPTPYHYSITHSQ